MKLAENVVIANKFRLSRELGRGGMGSVWLAQHQELDIPCAVKFIEGDAVNSVEMRERFTREARAAAQLRSPHVVQILDTGVWEDTPYIAMELLDGEDLGKRLRRLGRLSPATCVAILAQVSRALSKAHALGIVHRDLKPDNIYLVRDEERELVKILDFGIAKVNAHGLGNSSNTRTGAMLGTPYYMSPEQAQGNKAIDARSDVGALGVIGFEMLTGQKPFDSDALGDLLLKICANPITPILQAAPDLPPALEPWWTRASARDPARRFQSSRELVDALAAALGVPAGGDVVGGREPSMADQISPRASTYVADAAPLAQGTTGGRTVSPLVLTGADPKPKRSPLLPVAAVIAAVIVLGGAAAAMYFRTPAPPLTREAATGQPAASAAAQVAPTVEVRPVAAPPQAEPPTPSASAAPGPPLARGKPGVKSDTKPDVKPDRPVPPPAATPTPPKKAKDETGFLPLICRDHP